MLAGKSWNELCSSPKQNITKFKFPDPQKANPASSQQPPNIQIRGLVNLSILLVIVVSIKCSLGYYIGIDVPLWLPSLDEVIPSKIPLPHLVVLLYPFYAISCKYSWQLEQLP